jgi:hypothetical protein
MPGRIRLEDLPPEVARKIAGRTGHARKVRGSAPRRETPRSARFRCHDCHAANTTQAAAERHADRTGHRRIEWTWTT